MDIRFRRLRADDLPQLHAWLNEPHVRAWYGRDEPSDLDHVVSEYMPLVDGSDPAEAHVILDGDRPVGYVQTYRIDDHPAYAAAVAIDEPAAGLDLFLGDPAYVHRGVGPLVIRALLREIVFAPRGGRDVASCIIGPEPANAAAIRAYEKAGFRYLKTIQVPGEPTMERLMRIARDDM